MNEFALIDERGRAAGAGLRAAASFRPDPATTPTSSPSRTPLGMVWAAAVALVAVIAGVVYLTGRDTPPADEPAPTSLRYVLGELPEGWSVTSAKDAGVETSSSVEADVQHVLYGTSGDPTAPTLILLWSGEEVQFSASDFQAQGSDYREIQVAGQDAVCGQFGPFAALICAVPTSSDSGLGTIIVRAGGMTLDELATTVQALTLDPEPSLAVDALPSGAVLLSRGVGTDTMAVAAGEPDQRPIAAVEYVTADGEMAFLLTGDGATQQLAAAATITALTARVVDGTTYFVVTMTPEAREAGGQQSVLWSADGRVFAFSAPLPEDELVRLAASVRPASDEEWAAFTPRPGATTDESIPATADGTVAPPISVSPAYEVEVGMTVEPLPDGRVQLSSTGDGTSSSAFTLRLSETEFAFTAGSFSAAGGLNPIAPLVNPINAEPGVWAVIPGGGTLVVHTVDGGQFTARTSRPVEGVDVDFALVAVPLEVIAAEVFDADGTLLETWTPEA